MLIKLGFWDLCVHRSLLTHFRLDVSDRLFPNSALLTVFICITVTLWVLS
ncbi:hypothetical protein [Nostoc sp. KVJ20]